MKDGGSAFPVLESTSIGECGEYSNLDCTDTGMTLRDYFAGQALVGYCSQESMGSFKGVASAVYEIADAMLAEREKQNDGGKYGN
jgi:hypothetical protein